MSDDRDSHEPQEPQEGNGKDTNGATDVAAAGLTEGESQLARALGTCLETPLADTLVLDFSELPAEDGNDADQERSTKTGGGNGAEIKAHAAKAGSRRPVSASGHAKAPSQAGGGK